MFAANFFIDYESQMTLVAVGLIALLVAWLFLFILKRIQGKKDQNTPTLDHEWDGIREHDNPAPKVMHVIMIGFVLFGIWYLTLGYPLFSFSQIDQYKEEVKIYKQTFDRDWNQADHEELMALGESLFNSKCVVCHGYTGEGQNGKAGNLVSFGNVSHVIYVLKNGSKGLNKITPEMPALFSTLGEDEEDQMKHAVDVSAYVITLSGRTPHTGNPQVGKPIFEANCTVCHGPLGKGDGYEGSMPDMAANLTEYGTVPYIINIIQKGKKGHIGQMPSFEAEGTLSPIQYKALAEYVAFGLVEP